MARKAHQRRHAGSPWQQVQVSVSIRFGSSLAVTFMLGIETFPVLSVLPPHLRTRWNH
jgi:hypothetical protein